MRYLIRFLSRGPAGSIERHDRVYEGDVITLGRATDQVLHLKDRGVALQHATIDGKSGTFQIATSVLAGISVNGRSCRESNLSIGDQISIGSNLIKIIDPPAGYEFAFTFELDPDAKPQDVPTNWASLSLSASGWSKRRWSWCLGAIVGLIALAVPALSLIGPDVAGFLRTAPLPSDEWWAAGPLHAAHGGEAAACENCHANAFERVQDSECMACHTIDRHVGIETPAPAVLGQTRCASCHLEHNEPPNLIDRRQALCGDCHAGDGEGFDDLDLESASDFGTAHPEFRVSLLQPSGEGQEPVDWTSVRFALDGAAGRDRSNLKFPHAAHLDAGGLSAPEGSRVLDCGNCHVAETGGGLMQAITMEQHCADCHSLSFDPAVPDRTVPHGSPEEVVQELIEYYSARLLGGDADAGGRVILRPGQALSPVERDRVAAEAEQQAVAVAADLFERRTCITCHEVTNPGGTPMGYRIEPVRLTQQFFPHAHFSHAAHSDSVAECRDCHAAETSEVSSDVLMPGIQSCRDCHGSAIARRTVTGQTPTTCIICHSFHSEAKGGYQ